MPAISNYPLVSIIIPMYNSSKYVLGMLESIQNQTYENFEIIIIDDYSTDNSIEIVKNFITKDPRFKLYIRPKYLLKGANSCRNYGLEISAGELIIFADSDDIFMPYAFSQRVVFMNNNPELDFGVFPALSFDDNSKNFNTLYYGFKPNHKTLHRLINKNLPFITWCLIFRRESLIKKQLQWDKNLLSNQDADFNISCLIKGLNYKYCDAPPDYLWRQVYDSTWHKMILPNQAKSHIYYLNKIYNIFKDNNEFKDDLKLLSLWLFKKLIYNNETTIITFLSLKIFSTNKISKHKYKFIYYIINKIPNKFNLEYIFLLFFPYLSLKARYEDKLFPFSKIRKRNFKLLYNKIPLNYKYFINFL